MVFKRSEHLTCKGDLQKPLVTLNINPTPFHYAPALSKLHRIQKTSVFYSLSDTYFMILGQQSTPPQDSMVHWIRLCTPVVFLKGRPSAPSSLLPTCSPRLCHLYCYADDTQLHIETPPTAMPCLTACHGEMDEQQFKTKHLKHCLIGS